jgi:tRNA dimethylallyltransferase
MPSPLIVIGGPTATGKSALALRLAESSGGVVINADSMQVYRDLAVLTARPGPAEAARAPHRLYGVLDAADPCSAARWREMALAEIAAAEAAGRLPVLVGGTGLYIRALIEGIAEVPEIPAAIREEARALHRALGGEAFRARLAERDPAGAARLAPGDTQRLVRAYEVVAATGTPLAEWQCRTGPASPGFDVFAVTLLPERAALYTACDARLVAMIEGGALEEVRRLAGRGLDPGLPLMKAVGVRELVRHVAGEIGREEAVALAQRATRNYAKRQSTWFRHQFPTARIVAAQFSESTAQEIFSFLRGFLLTRALSGD